MRSTCGMTWMRVLLLLHCVYSLGCPRASWSPLLATQLSESNPSLPCSSFTTFFTCQESNYCCFQNSQCIPSNFYLVECPFIESSSDCVPPSCEWSESTQQCTRLCPFTLDPIALCAALSRSVLTPSPTPVVVVTPSPAPVLRYTRFPTPLTGGPTVSDTHQPTTLPSSSIPTPPRTTTSIPTITPSTTTSMPTITPSTTTIMPTITPSTTFPTKPPQTNHPTKSPLLTTIHPSQLPSSFPTTTAFPTTLFPTLLPTSFVPSPSPTEVNTGLPTFRPSSRSPSSTRAPLAASPPSSTRKTSFVILLADDLGMGDVTFVRPSLLFQTPNIDAMSKSSHVFQMNRFHSAATTCSPSRTAMLSGLNHVRNCAFGANAEFDKPSMEFKPTFPFRGQADKTLFRIAQQQGLKTFVAGKWHVSTLFDMENMFGVEEYTAVGGNLPTFDSSCFCLPEKKSCAFAGHYPDPANLGPNYSCRIKTTPNLLPVTTRNESAAFLYARAFEQFLVHTVSETESFLALLAFNEPHIPFIASPWVRSYLLNGPLKFHLSQASDKEKSLAADYYGAIMAMDSAVGIVRQALANSKRSADTMVIFTSDNGPEIMDWRSSFGKLGYGNTNGLRGYKRSLFEGGHRVPGLIEWPNRISSRTESNQLLSMVDVSATIFKEMLGDDMVPSDGVPIEEFSPTWKRERPLFMCSSWESQFPTPCRELAVMQNSFKMIVQMDDDGQVRVQTAQLFDVDVSEFVELSKTNPEFARMLDLAQEWTKQVLVPSLKMCNV